MHKKLSFNFYFFMYFIFLVLLLCFTCVNTSFAEEKAGSKNLSFKQDFNLIRPELPAIPVSSLRIDLNAISVPLNDSVKEYLLTVCEKYNVDPLLVLAVIEVESNFKSDLISSTNDFGLMQINKVNHKRLKAELGISNFLDPKENIHAGVYMLSELFSKYDDDIHRVLMAYNMGEGGASSAVRNGYYTSEYSRKVINAME